MNFNTILEELNKLYEEESAKKALKEASEDEEVEVEEEPAEEPVEETEEEIPEEDVNTVKDFAKSLDEYDGKLTLEFKPIMIDGKEYPVTGIMWDDSVEGKLVAEVTFDTPVEEAPVEEEIPEEAIDEEPVEEGLNTEVLPEEDEDLDEFPANLVEAYEYLVGMPDAKQQILDMLKTDATVAKYTTDDSILVPYYYKAQHLTSGIGRDGELIDFNILPDGNISVTNRRDNSIERQLLLNDVKAKTPRTMPTYKVIKAIDDAARVLNTRNRPGIRVRRDANVMTMLQENPKVAEELINHVAKINYIIPMINYFSEEFAADKLGEPLTDKALTKIEKICGSFFELPFAEAAYDAGMVDNRPAELDTNHNIENSWRGIGNITFDCKIGELSNKAQEIIKAAKVAGEVSDDTLKASKTTSCYRLANALIIFNDNDITRFI